MTNASPELQLTFLSQNIVILYLEYSTHRLGWSATFFHVLHVFDRLFSSMGLSQLVKQIYIHFTIYNCLRKSWLEYVPFQPKRRPK